MDTCGKGLTTIITATDVASMAPTENVKPEPPIIQSSPQLLSTSTIQRAGSHGTTLRTIRSKIGISTIDRPMKTPRIGLTTPMYGNGSSPSPNANGSRRSHRNMLRHIAACLLLAAPAAAQDAPLDRALTDFRKLHRAEVQRANIAGSSFYLIRNGRTLAADHLGEQDADAHVPVDANTIYHWASVTKTMTGIAILQLRDRGLLELDDR